MCQIAFIILGVIGLCGGITLKGLSIGVLITVGIQILFQVIAKCLEER